MQLFDEMESLAESVAAFLFEGWRQGQSSLLAVRPGQCAAITRRLRQLGCPVDEVTAAGRLVVLDAETTLANLEYAGVVDADRFEVHIGALVRRLIQDNDAGLRIYGEIVDVLASRGDYDQAERLERFWNDLSSKCAFTLLCGYSSVNFADERTAARLHAVCCAHDHATAKPDDMLGAWLLSVRQLGYQFGHA